MDKIFASKYILKRFLFTTFILSVLLLLIRYCLLPFSEFSKEANDNIASLIEKFTTSIFTAVVVGYFVYWMQVEEKKKEIEFTESGHEIENHLSRARLKTESWCFNGGLGRYTKLSTIPLLSDQSRKDRRTISIRLIVLNPFNIQLLQKYIAFRRSVEKNTKKEEWTELYIQSEILATIITAFYYRKTNQFLNITIHLKDFFTLSRMDISSSSAIITREDPAIPSIIVKEGSYMYKHYAEEFQQVKRQSRVIDYEFRTMETPSKAEMESCINELFPDAQLSADLIDLVCKNFIKPQSPF